MRTRIVKNQRTRIIFIFLPRLRYIYLLREGRFVFSCKVEGAIFLDKCISLDFLHSAGFHMFYFKFSRQIISISVTCLNDE